MVRTPISVGEMIDALVSVATLSSVWIWILRALFSATSSLSTSSDGTAR